MTEVQRADKAARQRAILAVACVFVLATAAMLVLPPLDELITRWIDQEPHLLRRKLHWVLLAGWCFFLPLLALALWLLTYAAKVVKGQRNPPLETAVIRDTKIINGRAAVRQGRMLQVLCALLILMSLLVPIWVAQVLQTLSAG